jgi:SagB-type dehydrogenase family enzyme
MMAVVVLATQGRQSKPPSIGERFHRETSAGANRLSDSTPTRKRQADTSQTPDALTVVRLPGPIEHDASLYRALVSRRSVRAYRKDPVSLQSISNLLWAASGLTGADDGFSHRTTPSAGALYPLEIYLVACHVDSLMPGVYHYRPHDSTLEKQLSGDYSRQLFRAGFQQDALSSPPCAIVITARFDQTTRKYADRGYRYAYMEAGAAFQNISLEAASSGLGTVVIGAFDDGVLNDLLGIDGTTEAALALMPVGHPR